MHRLDGAAPIRYDLLIRGGTVIDPANGRHEIADVAVAGGRIAAVGPDLPGEAAEVADARGLLVTPGLVDLHTHCYWGATYWGIEADPVAARTGVTTWLDAGSAGAFTFPGFRRYAAEASRARVFALLNISSIGLVARTAELANLEYCDVDLGALLVEGNRDLILGIKARVDRFTTVSTGVEGLRRARALADRVRLPLMVHIATAPPARPTRWSTPMAASTPSSASCGRPAWSWTSGTAPAASASPPPRPCWPMGWCPT
jgi:dihydroorotase